MSRKYRRDADEVLSSATHYKAVLAAAARIVAQLPSDLRIRISAYTRPYLYEGCVVYRCDEFVLVIDLAAETVVAWPGAGLSQCAYSPNGQLATADVGRLAGFFADIHDLAVRRGKAMDWQRKSILGR